MAPSMYSSGRVCVTIVQMVFGLALTMAPFDLVVVVPVALFMGLVFLYFFQKPLCSGLGFRFRG